MTKKNGLQGDSLTPDANGNFLPDELKAMYARWLKKAGETGDNPAGVSSLILPKPHP
jgi:hypothetical protein